MSGAFLDSTAMRMRTAYLSMHRHFQRLFFPFGVTADQYVLLKLAAEREGCMQKDLVAASCSDPNTVAAMVGRLVASELLSREVLETDRRAWRVSPTKAGLEKLKAMDAAAAATHHQLAAAAEKERMALLERIVNITKETGERK